jgi:hypothetical protein
MTAVTFALISVIPGNSHNVMAIEVKANDRRQIIFFGKCLTGSLVLSYTKKVA